MRGKSWFICGALLVTTSGVALAADPPPPTGVADLFVPAMSGLMAEDLCVQGSVVPCNSAMPNFFTTVPNGILKMDAAGTIYSDQSISSPIGADCITDNFGLAMKDWSIDRVAANGSLESIGVFREVCVPGSPNYLRRVTSLRIITLDAINGELYVRANVENMRGCCPGPMGFVYVKISGLPSIFELALTYQPATASFSWIVPPRPYALPGVDSFSVYKGEGSTASDLSQATPLDCTVPAGRPPVPGEQLTVPDTTADPAVGQATYFVVAANHARQTRVGRQAVGGVLQGRDATALTGCN